MSGKLTEKTKKVLDYLREHDEGDGVKITEMAEALDMSVKSVGPIVWVTLKAKKDGSRPALAVYEKRTLPNYDKPIGYARITDEGREFQEIEEEPAELD